MSVYGTEETFIDGDDTPWSKAFLTAAYASRGIKARCTSGSGSELLMGFHDAKSMLYLEARCLCLQRAMGVQGTQNGGIDGAPIAASVPGGLREILAENVLAALLDLECASGNDTRISESEIRLGAKIMPYPDVRHGPDLLRLRLDPEVRQLLQRLPVQRRGGGGFPGAAAGLRRRWRPAAGRRRRGDRCAARRAVDAVAAVLEALELAATSEAQRDSVVYASGSNDTTTYSLAEVGRISAAIRDRGITALDVVRVLAQRGFTVEAENLLMMLRQRVSGDYLQTAAIIRKGKVISAVNDPNDYAGPGTGYAIDEARWAEIKTMRDSLTRDEVLAEQNRQSDASRRLEFQMIGDAAAGSDPLEVVIGLSPAFGTQLQRTTAGHEVADVLAALMAGIAEGGGKARVVRIRHSADTSFVGRTAARSRRLRFRHRHPGQGHGGAPWPRPRAASQSRAVLHGADHYAGRITGDSAPTPRLTPRARRRSRSPCPIAARRWARATTCRRRCSTPSKPRWWIPRRRRRSCR